VAQWFSSFYWRDYTPSPYSQSQKQKLIESIGGTCALPNCNSKLTMEDGQFLHIKQYLDYNQDQGPRLVICKQCFDNIRDREKSVWIMLNE
jgi:hypothetical protein